MFMLEEFELQELILFFSLFPFSFGFPYVEVELEDKEWHIGYKKTESTQSACQLISIEPVTG